MTTYSENININVPEGTTDVQLGINLSISTPQTGGGGSPSDDIKAIPSLGMWLTTTVPSSITTNVDDKVSLWEDQSPNGRDATRDNPTFAPAYLGSGPVLFNSPTGVFSLDVANTALTPTKVAFVVHGQIQDSGDNFGRILSFDPASGGSDFEATDGLIPLYRDSDQPSVGVLRNDVGSAVTPLPYGTDAIITSVATETLVEIGLNGASRTTGVASGVPLSFNFLRIGVRADDGTTGFFGSLGDVIMLIEPTDADIAAAEQALAEIHSITLP